MSNLNNTAINKLNSSILYLGKILAVQADIEARKARIASPDIDSSVYDGEYFNKKAKEIKNLCSALETILKE